MSILDGLTKKAPAGRDASFTPPSGRVDEGAVRTGVGSSPKTLGPRKDGMS